jgi:hypothetical protein
MTSYREAASSPKLRECANTVATDTLPPAGPLFRPAGGVKPAVCSLAGFLAPCGF